MSNKNGNIFDIVGVKEDEKTSWQKEWQGMPEFIQEKKEEYAKIVFRFDNEEDLQEFAKLIGQKLTKNTKSAWHPQLVRGINSNKVYVDIEESTHVPSLLDKFSKPKTDE